VYFTINIFPFEINDYAESSNLDEYPVISLDNVNELQRIDTLGWGIVTDVAWLSSTGNIAVASSSGVWIVDPSDFTVRPTHKTAKNGVTSISVSEDETSFITTSFDHDVTLWETNTGLELFRFKEHQNLTINAYYSLEHNVALSLDAEGQAIFWDSISQNPILMTNIGNHSVADVNITSINPTIIIANSETHSLSLRDIKTGAILSELASEEINGIEAIAFSADNSTVAIGGTNGIRLWRTEENELDDVDLPFSTSVSKIAFSNDGEVLAYGDARGNMYVYRINIGTIEKLDGLTTRIVAMEFHENNTNLVAAELLGNIKIWDLNADSVSPEIYYGDRNAITKMAVSDDTKTIITTTGQEEILLWDATQGQVREVINISSDVEDISLNPVDGSLAIAKNDGIISLWDINSVVPIRELRGDGTYIQRIAFSIDGKYLVSVGETIKFWDVQSESEISSQSIITEWPIQALAYGFSDLVAFATTGNGEIYLSYKNKDITPQLFGEHGSPVSELYFDHTGQYLVSISPNRVKVWPLTIGEPIQIYDGGNLLITDIAFSHDASILFLSASNRLSAFDINTQKEILNLEGNFSGIRNIEISKDNKLIYTAGSDGTIQIWGIANEN